MADQVDPDRIAEDAWFQVWSEQLREAIGGGLGSSDAVEWADHYCASDAGRREIAYRTAAGTFRIELERVTARFNDRFNRGG